MIAEGLLGYTRLLLDAKVIDANQAEQIEGRINQLVADGYPLPELNRETYEVQSKREREHRELLRRRMPWWRRWLP